MRERWAAALALSLMLLLVYAPVFRSTYLYHDDWQLFKSVKTSCAASPFARHTVVRGSLISPYLHCGLFRSFDTIDRAWVGRSIVVIGILVFAFVQLACFRVLGLGWLPAAALALGTSVLPGVMVSAFWLTAGGAVATLVAAACAALIALISVRPGVGPVRRTAALVAAAGLVLTCLFMSQLATMYVWALAAAMLATELPRDPRRAARSLAVFGIAFGIPMAGYFVWFKYLSGLEPLLRLDDPKRGTLFGDLPGSAMWFVSEALAKASSLWLIDLPRAALLAALGVYWVAAFAYAARAASMARQRADRTGALICMAYPVVLAGLIVLAFLPVLITQFHVPVYRNLVAVSALMFVTGAIHAAAILRADTWSPVVRVGIAAVFAAGVAAISERTLAVRMVLPAAMEYSYVRDTLRDATLRERRVETVHVILPRRKPERLTDEVGTLSSQYFQDVRPLVEAVQTELGLRLVVSVHIQSEGFRQADALTLDFASLAKTGVWPSALGEDPALEPIPLWLHGTRHYLYLYRGRVFGVPLPPGQMTWHDGTDQLPRAVEGATIDEVVERLEVDETLDPKPNLLGSHDRYNLVSFRGRIYAVPQALGTLGEDDWLSGRVASLPGVFVDRTVDGVRRRLTP